jgi:branched-chain amino acid transport system substrate-binding protein
MAGCSAPTGEGAADNSADGPIKVGLLAPLTGATAADGSLMKRGAELAIAELNREGGIKGRKIELVVEDVKNQQSDAVAAAATELTTDSAIAAVFTGYASLTNFEIDLLAEAGIPYLLGGGSAQTEGIIAKDPDKYPGVWSVAPTYEPYESDLPVRLASWDADGTLPLRNKKVYIISSDNPYSNGIATGLVKNFTAAGWDIAGPDTVPFGEVNDWTPQLSKIRDFDPSVVINLDYQTSNAVRFVSQFRDSPSDSLLFSQYAPNVPEFAELAGKDADGILFSNLAGRIESSAYAPSVDFAKTFESKYGAQAGGYAAMVYEEVMVWADAVQRAGGDSMDKDAVAKALAETELEDTAVGTIRFDPDTHLAEVGDTDGIPLQFFQMQEEKPVLLAPEAYAEGEFQRPKWMSAP